MVGQIKENYTLFFSRKKANFAIFLAQGVGFIPYIEGMIVFCIRT